MNGQKLTLVIIPIVLIFATVVATVSVFAGGGNQLGGMMMLIIFTSAFIGLLAPKAALLMFVIAQFYVDFFKRLLILGDALSQEDVMISLGLGPALIIVACVSCTAGCITGRIPFSFKRDGFFCIGCVGVSLLGAVLGTSGMGAAAESRGLIEMGQAILGSSMLGMSAFASYLLLRNPTDRLTTLRWLSIGGMPMALYTIYQSIFGISLWEETYIKSGMSAVLYNFYLVAGGIDGLRPFSTLNTHVSVGAISATMFVLMLLIMSRNARLFHLSVRSGKFYVLLSILYLASCLLCQNRTTYFLPLFAIAAAWLFSSGLRTILFYASSVFGFAILVLSSSWLNDRLLVWTVQFESTSLGKKFGTLGTYQDRLKGLISLQDGRNWTPFGMPPEERPGFHDQITEIVLKLGYVPLLVGAGAILLCIAWWHRRSLSMADPMTRKFMTSLSAVIVSLGICGVAYGNMLFVAPVNSVLGILLGIGMSTIRSEPRLALLRHLPSVPTAAPNAGPMHPAGR